MWGTMLILLVFCLWWRYATTIEMKRRGLSRAEIRRAWWEDRGRQHLIGIALFLLGLVLAAVIVNTVGR